MLFSPPLDDRAAYARAVHLDRMVGAVRCLVDDGYSREEIRGVFADAVAHLDGDPRVPHARGVCSSCGAVCVAWSEYQWVQLVALPCRSCGKPW